MDIITKKEAIVKELKRYYTGKVCKNGHDGERYVNDSNCVEAERKGKYQKKYRAVNAEQIKEYQKEYKKKYRAVNVEQIKEYQKEYKKKYRKEHPEKVALQKHEYLLRKELATPQWYEDDLVRQIYIKRDELSELWHITLHVDHIVPLQGKTVCGLHCWDNLQLLEASLNLSKNNSLND